MSVSVNVHVNNGGRTLDLSSRVQFSERTGEHYITFTASQGGGYEEQSVTFFLNIEQVRAMQAELRQAEFDYEIIQRTKDM